MNEDFAPIGDVITLIANDQHAEATPIIHDLLGARVLDAMQGYKQEIAQSLFAPSELSEETEQIDELSKGTLKSYIGKAAGDALSKSREAASATERANSTVPKKYAKRYAEISDERRAEHRANALKASQKSKTRTMGIQTAASKLEEETEQIDEENVHPTIRKKYMQIYGSNWGQRLSKDRKKGISGESKYKKEVKEETEQIDELSKKTLGSYVRNATMDFGSAHSRMGYRDAKSNYVPQNKQGDNFQADDSMRSTKRLKGINRAVTKMGGTQLEEAKKKELGYEKSGKKRGFVSKSGKFSFKKFSHYKSRPDKTGDQE